MFKAQKWATALKKAQRDDRRSGSSLKESKFNKHLLGEIRTLGATKFSIRDLFESFVEDGREIANSWSPRSGGTKSGINLQEAGVDTAAFSNVTGQIVYSEVLEAFNDPIFLASQLAKTVPTQFNGEKIAGIGRLGDEAEAIGEGEAYPMAGVSEEWTETPETTKRGFIVPVTKEAVFFDRTGLVLNRASETATWLAINKEKRVLDVVLGVTSTYNRNGSASIATYGNDSGTHNWDNLAASNALQDWTDVENALLLFDGITDPNTAEPVLINPNTLIIPTALSFTAQRIVGATEIREVTNSNTTSLSPNPLGGARPGGSQAAQFNVLSNQYVSSRQGDSTTWHIGDPMSAFYYMENSPIQTGEAPTNSEMEFSNDIIGRYKVSERGACHAFEPRKMVQCTA